MKFKTPLIASIGALLLVSALFLSLLLSSAPYRPNKTRVVRPSDTTDALQNDKLTGKNYEIVGQAEITSENVQRVIASLSRPESYTALVSSRLYYGDQYGQLSCRQSVKGGAYRVDYLADSGATERTELLWKDKLYAWKSGASSYFEGAQGAFTADQMAMLPTYETVCNLPSEQVVEGGLLREGDELLLSVTARVDQLESTYQISVGTGLLKTASFASDGKVIRSVTVDLNAETPSDGMFVLPGAVLPVFDSTAIQ